ncbi:MAG: 5-bromo-4-chloroindolyl phosphate hydrolysis family protein [Fusicatenibacter sp.]|nr:5-bromo-4-chloroindolyl phosphate hydrolysis family protein [Lachnospiraceae bacterium]MDY2938196.1 5-bromo-4-chloroindolyl phosphate hydrolysis family protein [Fusicatenibacter sp.]
MSFEDDLKDVGDSIGRLVDNAVNSQNFQELNQKISETINQFVYPSRQGPYRADGSSSAPEKNTVQKPGLNQWMTLRMQNKERFMAPSDLTFTGGFQLTVGGLLSGIFGLASLGILIALIGGGFHTVLLILLAVFLGLTGTGSIFIRKGKKNRNLVRHFRQICSILGSREYISLGELSDRMNLTREELLPELSRMIEKSMFRQGHLDKDNTCLMVTNNCYHQYQELLEHQYQQQLEQEKRKKELEASGLTLEYQEMLAECEDYIHKIHQCNEDLPGEVISSKLSRLELVVTRILSEAKKRPKEIAQLRKFMDYYMPTTWKLLDSYRNFDREPIQSENIRKTKKEIEQTLDTINEAFEKLLNDLFQTTAWDISSDISVLEAMLAQEGLTGKGMNGLHLQ